MASASAAQTPLVDPACEAYNGATSVFVGVAGAPVWEWVNWPDRPDQPAVRMKLTPFAVERTYVGERRPTMFVTPLGLEAWATAGKRYVVYAIAYRPPDIVMASPGSTERELVRAQGDLAFLDALSPGATGGTIAGVVEQWERAPQMTYERGTPLAGVAVRIVNDEHAVDAVTDALGRFVASALPAGKYHVTADLPNSLRAVSASDGEVVVKNGGCASIRLAMVPNGRVRGMLRGSDGRPLGFATVDLVPMDVPPDEGGRVRGSGSVSTNQQGEFAFDRRTRGWYYLGVSLGTIAGPYPRTYYPGTPERSRAVPVFVDPDREVDGLDFAVPEIAPRGELEVRVDSRAPGRVIVCLAALGAAIKGERLVSELKPGGTFTMQVVEGEAYEVHVHLLSASGHLESEPFVFTASAETTRVTLRPDAPRTLHVQ